MSTRPLCDLQGMIALVTGAGGGLKAGLGPTLALGLAEAGATVAVNDTAAESTQATVIELRRRGFTRIEGFSADLTDPEQVDSLIQRVVTHFGQLDIVVNRAEAHDNGSRADELSEEESEKLLALNLHAAFYLSRAAVRVMRPHRFGRIIHVSNIVATRTSVCNGVAYVAAKEALYGLTRHLALEVAQHGITVNALLPGFVLTPSLTTAWSDERIGQLSETIPTLRPVSLEEVGSAVVLLASRDASSITGAATPIDGQVSIIPGARTSRKTAFA